MQPVAVVTGASSGIGAATAAQLAGAGYHVVLAARRADRLEQAAARARERGGSAQTALLDVTDTAAVAAFARSLDRCDVLVNNAGGAIGIEDVADADPADWTRRRPAPGRRAARHRHRSSTSPTWRPWPRSLSPSTGATCW